ncbi:MAG: hypothetical protein HY860_05915, partial [Chlamydiales bacterium]|nr:hypothetical protein [Chlamydiales bacterium]
MKPVQPIIRLIKEMFPNNQEIQINYDEQDRITETRILHHGTIRYDYEGEYLEKVKRFSEEGTLLYQHKYEQQDENGIVYEQQLIDDLGEISYQINEDFSCCSIKTPFSFESICIDEENRQISLQRDESVKIYDMDLLGQLIIDTEYDSLGNPIKATVNERNELLSYKQIQCSYDENGNLIKKTTPYHTTEYSYDAMDRLIEVKRNESIAKYTYDLNGRRLSKEIWKQGKLCSQFYFLYIEDKEIGIYDA